MNNGYHQVIKSQSNPVELQVLYRGFIGEKMKMDKFLQEMVAMIEIHVSHRLTIKHPTMIGIELH